MAAAINFLSGDNFTIYQMGGSGLGFYGPGTFGSSVRVGQYNSNTYITDSTGSVNGPQVNNIMYVGPFSGDLGGGNIHALQDIPNYLAPLTIQFTNDTPVQCQNVSVTIFDRSNTNNPPVGVTCMVAELVHPWTTSQPTGPLGSGDTQWSQPGGSGGLINGVTYDAPLSLTPSPGSGGWAPSGTGTTDTIHQWSLAISASPDSVGSKSQFGLFFSLEYL